MDRRPKSGWRRRRISLSVSNRMLKKSASIRRLLSVRRERLKVKRRSIEGSSSETFHLSPFTKNKDSLFEHPDGLCSYCAICADHRRARVPTWYLQPGSSLPEVRL